MGRGTPCRALGGSGTGTPVPLVAFGVGLMDSPPIPGSALLGGTTLVADNPPISFRETMNFNVLGFDPSDDVVHEIYVEETIGFELPLAKIVLINQNATLSSLVLAKEQSSFTVAFGYDNPGIKVHGTYIVQRPKFKFMQKNGDLVVEIVAYGEMVKMAATERRQCYQKMADADIAGIIAKRNGFASVIAPTGLVHDQVIQANESDYKFLAKRAKLYGFLLYVEDGVLHFHPPRPRESGIVMTYLQPGENNLESFVVQSRTLLRGLQVKMTQVDPVTKEEFEVDSRETPDSVQRVTDFQNWKDLVSIPGVGQPQKFVTNEGHEQIRPSLQNQVVTMSQASRYVISGMGQSYGLETLRANDLITINGIGRNSGRFYVTKAIHRLSGKTAYTTQFEVVRAGAGQLQAFPGQTTPVSPPHAGTVTL